ncbi:hypothetical protein TFLX_04745 [Thermoflexales bacterium]|nr:hypothetical protein TFLX_04745 [Thermoflexales bacterium]
MPKRTWEVVLDEHSHLIQLNHGLWTSKHEIWLDGQMVARSRHFIDVGSQHTFEIGQHYCEVHVASNGFQYRYLLFVDGTPYLAREDSCKKCERDKLIRTGIAAYQYWRELARLLGLKYLPNPESSDPFRQRLLGEYKKYVTLVQPSTEKERTSVGVGVLVRYLPVDNVATLRNQIMTDPAVDQLLGKEKTWRCTIENNVALCVFPYRPLKIAAAQVASQVLEWIEALSRSTGPVGLDHCEGDNCPDRNAPIQVVLINGFPTLLCAHCTTKIPGWGGELQRAYQDAPDGLVNGFVSGMGIAILSALAWAAIAVFFNAIAALLSYVVFIGTVKLMDRMGVKRTGRSLLLASLLTLFGAALGAYLALAWEVASELPQRLMLSNLPEIMSAAWQALSATSLLRQAIGFSLMGIIPILIWMWWEQRKHYSRMFRPDVEVVGAK